MNTRVYTEKTDINGDNTRSFYNERAKRWKDMECPYTLVLLGDQDPSLAEKYNRFEKESILPKIRIDSDSTVLDIGCGMGRWAESLIPICGQYVGTDFSDAIIDVAKSRCAELPNAENSDFKCMSFQKTVSTDINDLTGGKKINRLLVCGVEMYINDNDLLSGMKSLMNLLDDKCVIYFTETVAIKTRLTLDSHPSEALKTTYDAIYRTPDEYLEIYNILIDKGFRIVEKDFLPHINNDEKFSETDRWYVILER